MRIQEEKHLKFCHSKKWTSIQTDTVNSQPCEICKMKLIIIDMLSIFAQVPGIFFDFNVLRATKTLGGITQICFKSEIPRDVMDVKRFGKMWGV